MARLSIDGGPARGQQLEVNGQLIIGRSESGPGALGNDPELSRRHAQLHERGGQITVEDLGSTNGTLINGRPITGPTVLRPDDVLEVGSSRMRLVSGAPAAGPVAVVAAPVVAAPALTTAAVPAFRPPPVAVRQRRQNGIIAAIVIATIVIVAVQFLTRSPSDDGISSVSNTVVAGIDGTAYIESNVAVAGENSVLAMHYRNGSFRPYDVQEYPTGGSGSFDLSDRGVLDGDHQIATNANDTLLFAVNQGSDTIAVFTIAADGSLAAVAGSPFPSGGTAPISVGVSGNILVVANKAQDGVRNLLAVPANYTTMTIAADGALSPTGHTVNLGPRASPVQVLVGDGGTFVFASDEAGDLEIYRLGSDGSLTPVPGSPYALPNSIFTHGPRPVPVWPAGLSTNPNQPILYTGIPNYNGVAAYSYDSGSGQATLDSTVFDPKAILPCWSVVSPDGKTLYFANAGSDNLSVFDIGTDPTHPSLIQTVALRGGGDPWGLAFDPDGRYLYAITPRQVAAVVPVGQGQLIHTLIINADGTLSELPDSPVPIPAALNTNPFGLAIVPAR